MWYGNGFMWHTNIESLKSGSEKMLWTMWNWVEEGDLKYISFVDETDFMSFLYLAEIPSSISHPDAPNQDLMLYRTDFNRRAAAVHERGKCTLKRWRALSLRNRWTCVVEKLVSQQTQRRIRELKLEEVMSQWESCLCNLASFKTGC